MLIIGLVLANRTIASSKVGIKSETLKYMNFYIGVFLRCIRLLLVADFGVKASK